MTTTGPLRDVDPPLSRELEPARRRFLFPSWIWIALLFLAGLPGALASASVYHGDERFYTDAALAMERGGTLLVPHYADGSPRLNKPLLGYWLIVASHGLLGVGLFQSRLPFALAGAFLIALAGSMARRALRDRRAGALAALILASNYDVLTLAARSTPDILVCAFALLALDGAARVVLEGEEHTRGPYSFWIGAGLVTAAKGLWGPLLVAFVLLGAWSRAGLRARARKLLRPIPAGLGLALGAAGVVPLLAAGTNAVLEQGSEDQLRASPSPAVVLHNAAEYLPSLLIHLLPWSALLVLALLTRAGRRGAAPVLKTPFTRAALAWWALLVLVFLFGSARRVRYLAPALAPVAIALAPVLLALARREHAGALVQRVSATIAGLAALALLALAALLARHDAWLASELGILGGACLVLAVLALRRVPAEAPLLFGWSAFLALLAFLAVLRPGLGSSPLAAIAARVEAEGAPAMLAVSAVPESVVSRLRLASGGRLEPLAVDESARERGDAPRLVLCQGSAAKWLASGYTELAEFDGLGGPSPDDLRRWWKGESQELRGADPAQRFVLLRRERP